MKQIYLAVMLVVLCSAITKAQNNATFLKVFLQADKNDTVKNATVQLFSLPDSNLIKTEVFTTEVILFEVNNFSKYFIKTSCIGFEEIIKTIAISNKSLSTTILLKRTATNLQGITVVSKKPLIKQEDDKTIVDAEVLANSSTNAFEILEKTPGAVVDQDGNVYLSSINPATVFINGREMKLSSADLASLLKSLPAGSVSKIEILRNPSAKYDAASSGGIINIVLKKGIKLGSNGSVNVSHFQGVYGTTSAGLNINKSIGKINSYISYQYTKKNSFEEIKSNRLIQTDASLLAQKSFTTYPSANHYIGAGIDYAFTKKFNIAYDVRTTTNNNTSNTINNNTIFNNITQQVQAQTNSDIATKNKWFYIGNNLSGKYKIDSLGSELTVELDYNRFNSNNNQFYTNNFLLPSRPIILGDGESNNYKNIFVAQTDLTYKLPNKITLEAGFKFTYSNSKNSALYFLDTANIGRKVDDFQTNTFKYKETITAAYLQVAKTFWGFTLKPGIRLETTNILGRQLIPKDTSLSIKRTDLFPYIYLRHKLFKLMGMQLVGNAIYRRTIKRPYYEILNPFPMYVDQFLFDVGNPNLKPQFTTNYEVNVMVEDFPVFAFGQRQTKDIFSNVTYQDDATKIAYRTYDNLGKNDELYFRIIGGIPPGGKYFFYVGAEHSFNKYEGVYQNKPLQYSRGSWVFFLYQEWKATNTFTLNMQGFMRTKGLQNFYELNNFGGLYLSANKKILKKKGNLILSINDVFRTNQNQFTLNQANVSASGSRINDTLRIGLTFRYSFGLNKPKENNEFGTNVEGKVN